MKSQVMENIFGQMEKLMMENGKIIKCMVKDFCFGEMVKSTKETL
jgi:hypothetical protein